MFIQYEGRPYWLINGTADETAALSMIPKREKMFVLIGAKFLHDPSRLFSRLEDAGRIVSLWSPQGMTFTEVLFSGERQLNVHNQLVVLERIDPEPVNDFWSDQKNRRALARLCWYRTGEAKVLAHRALVSRMSAVIDAAEQHIIPLRRLEFIEIAADRADAALEDIRQLEEVREFLEQEGLYPNG